MYKITLKNNTPTTVLAKKTHIGDLMMVKDQESIHDSEILLHTFNGFVSLTNPENIWSFNCTLNVKLLPKDSILTIKI